MAIIFQFLKSIDQSIKRRNQLIYTQTWSQPSDILGMNKQTIL